MDKVRLDLLTLMPDDTPGYMAPAWIGCMQFAITTDYILGQYRIDTGDVWKPAKTPIDEMIDHATGREEAFVMAFVAWANVNIWGSLTKR